MDMDRRRALRFEEAYAKAPFSELIRLAIALAALMRKSGAQQQERRWRRPHDRRTDRLTSWRR